MKVSFEHLTWSAVNGDFPKDFPRPNRVRVYFSSGEDAADETLAAEISDIESVTSAITEWLEEIGLEASMEAQGEVFCPLAEVDEIRERGGGRSVVKLTG